jgi:hypothetical protein
LACYYFPPTFEEVHNKDRRTKWQEFKDFDFIGAILFIGGITVLLLGISWGGITYPWKSAGVIVPLIIGALALVAFGFWEVYGNLKESLVPYKLFKNVRGFTMVLVADFVGGMLLYALISLYPVQIATVYESNPAVAAWESCTLLMGTFVSIILMGNILGRIGHARLIFAVSVGLNTIFLGCMAAMSEYLKRRRLFYNLLLTSPSSTFNTWSSACTDHPYRIHHRFCSTCGHCNDHA